MTNVDPSEWSVRMSRQPRRLPKCPNGNPPWQRAAVQLPVALSSKTRYSVHATRARHLTIKEAQFPENAFLVWVRSLPQLWSWRQHHTSLYSGLTAALLIVPSCDWYWPYPISRSLLLYTSRTVYTRNISPFDKSYKLSSFNALYTQNEAQARDNKVVHREEENINTTSLLGPTPPPHEKRFQLCQHSTFQQECICCDAHAQSYCQVQQPRLS